MERRGFGLQSVDPERGVSLVIAITGYNDHALIAHVDQIDIVNPTVRNKLSPFAIETEDMQAGLLVGADYQALARCSRIEPDECKPEHFGR